MDQSMSSNRPPQVLVTGGSGSIGSAVTDRLQDDGWSLVHLSHVGDELAHVVADFASDQSLTAAIQDLKGPFLGAVFCHGVLEAGAWEEITPTRWRRLLDVNAMSIYVILHSLLPKVSEGGSIVLISSTAAFDHSPVGGVHYTVSKWMLNGLVRHLCSELGPRRIRINAVCPGFIDNVMGRAYLSQTELDAAVAHIPLRRPGTPTEVAEAVSFLLADASSYMTGTLLPVSGGFD